MLFFIENKKNIKYLICIFLVVPTFLIYFQVQDHEFINYDDQLYVTENINLKDGFTLEGIIWAFTNLHDGIWLPITWLSHMLDYQLYGLNPKGHHLSNLFFHIANALILFIVLLRMTRSPLQSGLVAALFALHPFSVESVAWIAERKNVLSTFFGLLTIWSYINYIQKPEIKKYLILILFFVLCLMSKPMLVTLPFALLLFDYWPLGRLKVGINNQIVKTENQVTLNHLIIEKLPLFIFSIGSSLATFKILNNSGAAMSQGLLSLQDRIIKALVSYIKYLEIMVWPKGLSILYPHPGNTLPLWKGLICGLVLIGITVVVVRLLKKAPYLAVGWFWYLGILVPVIGIVQVGNQAMADRYSYVPLIGIFIIIAWGLPDLMEKWHHRKKVLILLAGIYIPTLMTVTWNQVSVWKNSVTIFEHAIRVTDNEYPGFALAHNNLGTALKAEERFEEAISHFNRAIKINPSYELSHNNLGNALLDKGKIEEAISHYIKAIELKPDYASAYSNLGNALLAKGNTGEAISNYKTAIRLKPNNVEAHYNLGTVMLSNHKTEEAISHFKIAIKHNPFYARAYQNLGFVFSKQGKTDEAITQFKTAIKLNPNNASTHHNLGINLSKEWKIEEAISHYIKAIELKPDYASAYSNLGNALLAKGNTGEAISNYKTAIRLKPGYADAHHNLGYILFLGLKYEEAISHYRWAIKLQPDMAKAHQNLKIALQKLEVEKSVK